MTTGAVEAIRQGENRLAWFFGLRECLKRFPEWERQVSFYVIPGIDHDCLRAYADPRFVEFALGIKVNP